MLNSGALRLGMSHHTHHYTMCRLSEQDHLIEHFPRVVQDNQALLDNAEKLMELTLANLWFASYAPSLNAVASYVIYYVDL